MPPLPKPLTDGSWATDPGRTSAPALARVQTGNEGAQAPDALEDNFLQNTNWAWIQYLDSVVNDDNAYQPTIKDLDLADYSTRRGWYRLKGPLVEFHFQMNWTNTDGGLDANDIEINLPYQAADLSGGAPQPPLISTGRMDLLASIWPDKATDQLIQAHILHTAIGDSAKVQRVVAAHTSPGFVAIGNASTQVSGVLEYFTDGVFLL